MRKLNLTAVSSLAAVSCVVLPLLAGCTGIMSGDPSNHQPTGSGPGGPGPGAAGTTGAGGTPAVVGPDGTTVTLGNKPAVGVVTIGRLNRSQYANTLRKLLGTKLDPSAKFPPDDLS